MNNERDLTENELLLIKKAKAIWNEFEFMFGISFMCQGEEATKAMLEYMDSHPDADSSEITEYAVEICDKYNPHLNA